MTADVQPVDELYCLFAPTANDLLLLPDEAVVETVNMQTVDLRGEDPQWLLGELQWQGRAVPVVSFEGLCGHGLPDRSRRSRAMIVNAPGRYLDGGLLALLIQGHPQLIGVNARAVDSAPLLPEDAGELVLARVSLGNRQPLIPDLEAIEAAISDTLGRHGSG